MQDRPKALDVKIFVPAKDFKTSLDFYTQLGWQINWEHEGDLAELELAGTRLFLQNFYVKKWAENFMIYVSVENAQAWFEHVSAIKAPGDFPRIRVNPPKLEGHGDIVTYVWDPSRILLHFAERPTN